MSAVAAAATVAFRSRLLLELVAAAAVLLCSAQASSPPALAGVPPHEAQPFFAREGKVIRLPCPVSNGMFMEWMHNGQTVSEATSDVTLRSDGRNSFLRINSPTPSSAGLYTCRVTNGFGSLSLNMTLIVLGPNGTATEGSGPSQPGDEPPHFTSVDAVNHEVTASAAVRLRCRARGKPPQLTVKWFVNGVELVEDRSAAAIGRVFALELGGQQLRLESLKAVDSGSYTCLVYNRAGSVNHTYLLTVHEPTPSLPDRGLSVQPLANGSFPVGADAVLQCRVNSAATPRIRWLKEASERWCDLIEPPPPDSPPTETIGGRRFVQVKPVAYESAAAAGAAAQPNVHLSKLRVESFRPEHAGVYLCLAAVGSQVLYRETHVTVADEATGGSGGGLPAPSSTSPSWPYVFGSQSATLAVIVAVPSLIAILVAIVVIYTVNKRKQERRAYDAKQKRLLLRHDLSCHQQQQQQKCPQHGSCGGGSSGGCGGSPNEVSASPDFAFEAEKASSGGGSSRVGSAAMAYRPVAAPAALLGAMLPPQQLLPAAAAAVGPRLMSTAAYSCSDGSYSFVQQQPAAYYGQQQQRLRQGSGGYASSSDSGSHFSSVSRSRGICGGALRPADVVRL